MKCTADAQVDTGGAESYQDMHVQTSCLCICITIAISRFSRAAWVADSTLPSIPYLSHQRDLRQVPGCGSPAWQCSTSSGQRMQISDSVHLTVLAGNCTALFTSLGLWQCGATLVQGDVIAAVQQGSCSSSRIDPQQQLCTQPSTPAPAPGMPSCPPWAVTALLSACPQPGAPPLQAAQLSIAAAQALSSAHIGFSTIAVFPAVVPVQGRLLCATPGAAMVGRHLAAAHSVSGTAEGQTAMQALEAQMGLATGSFSGLEDSPHAARAGVEGSARQLMEFAAQPAAVVNRTYYLELIRRMEQLLEAAPPTTAYNRTALLLLYQSILDGSGRAPGYFQPPVSAPDAEFVAEVQEGSQGANPVVTAPAAAQEASDVAAVGSAAAQSPARATLYPVRLLQLGAEIRDEAASALAAAAATAPYPVGRHLAELPHLDADAAAEVDAMLADLLVMGGSSRALLSEEDMAGLMTPGRADLLHVHAHLLQLVSQAPAASALHNRRRKNGDLAGYKHAHHRHLGETPGATCCCEAPQGFDIHVGAESRADAGEAARALASALPSIMTTAQPGSCLASVNISSLQRQVMTLSGCISYEQCPDGSEPTTWQCAYNSTGVPVEIEALALLDALPSAKAGLCKQVGQAMVVCNMTVLTAQAYAAMTNGTCSPACSPSVPCPKAHAAVLALGFALAPGPAHPPSCPGGRLPIAWNCTHLGQPFEFDANSYQEAAPLAAKEKCGLVGVTNVLCGGLVMEAIAYQALVEGTCRPVCESGPLEPCPSAGFPAGAPAPALAPPLCPQGLPGAWRCGSGNGSLLFDEATYQELWGVYPGRCTALTLDALLCGTTLLTTEAQSALSAHTCRHTCEKASPCVLPAPAPAPFTAPAHLRIPSTAAPSTQALTASLAYLTFARRAVAPVPGPAPAPLACPIGQYMGQVTCSSGSSDITADASELDAALKAFQAGRCTEVNTSSASLIQCSGTFYERDAFLGALAGNCMVQCLHQKPCASPPGPAPAPERLVVSEPFQARRRYQPAPVEAPVLATAAPAPQSNAVCTCASSDRGVRPGPSITFEYADTCPPPGETANLPDIIYFQAMVNFSDSAAIQDADVASFTIATSAPDGPAQCPCGTDKVKAQRMSLPQGAIQSVTLSGCNSARVIGYIRVPVYSAPEASITLSLRNGTVASPCGGVYGAGQASRVVQIRPRPQLLPTNMAFQDGLPATASATALFTLIFQRPVSASFGPADFLIGGLASTAYLRAVPMPGHPEATRIAVDLPQDFCGAASLALRFPDSITASDNGAGVCPDGGSSVVTWTRVCGRAGDALIPISAVEIAGSGDADSQCAAAL